jgi:hypothetical protein
MPVRTDGPVFAGFKRILADVQRRPLSPETEACSRSLVEQLLETRTTNDRPGMLLGRIQSGKTRAFVGAIAIAFDSEFDIAVVLTKGTVALTTQTVARLRADLADSVRPREVIVEDIRHMPEQLSHFEQNRKLVLVCKKENRNLQRLRQVMLEQYPGFAQRRILLIDDEADNASIGYRRQGGLLDLRVIPEHIDFLRAGLDINACFLQVTATPQALYLQPVNIDLPGAARPVRRVRPIFTTTVPIHQGYIGGTQYFEDSLRAGSPESFLHVPIDVTELDALRQDSAPVFQLADVLTTPAVSALRRAIVTFVVAGRIRQLQQGAQARRELYSFVVHTETKKRAHQWQERVVRELVDRLQQAAVDMANIAPLVASAYADLVRSITAEGLPAPSEHDVMAGMREALESLWITTVNTDRDMVALLDESGQLRLRTPFNVFIGGQILDRGITIDNLIGFYYGRDPQQAQADTTLQHCRMYGNRLRADVAVTRFYTTPGIYRRMRGIHERDEALWRSIERGEQDPDKVFLQADATGNTRPCGLTKILASTVTTISAGREVLPSGFSTASVPRVRDARSQLDGLLQPHADGQPFEVSVETAIRYIDLAQRMLKMDAGEMFDWAAAKAAVRFIASHRPDGVQDSVFCFVRRGRNTNKFRNDGGVRRYQNDPVGSRDPALVRQASGRAPGLILQREEGLIANEWTGEPFYWPILVVPGGIEPFLFSEENN